MAKLLKLRRGTTSQHSSFTGAEGEVTVNTDNDSLVVHDGSTSGGHELLRKDLSNAPAGVIDNADVASNAAIAGTKISPNFGSQNITTSGGTTSTSSLVVSANTTIGHGNSTGNQIKFSRSGLGDELVIGTDGYGNSTQYEATIQSSIVTARPLVFATNNTERLKINGNGTVDVAGNLDVGAGIDVTGNITATGNIDISSGNLDIGALPDTTTNSLLKIAIQDTDGTLKSDDSIKINPAQNVLNVDGTIIAASHMRASGNGPLQLTTSNGNGNVDINVKSSHIEINGNLLPATDSTDNLGSNTVRWANVYADTLYGDGSNLTGVSSVGGSTGVDFNDNVAARFGTGNDAAIKHDGYSTLQIGYSDSRTSVSDQTPSGIRIINNSNTTGGLNGIYFASGGGQANVGIFAKQLDNATSSAGQGCDMIFYTKRNGQSNMAARAKFTNYGDFVPTDNSTYDLGSSSLRWANLYTNDLHLSNEGHTNSVDGTWGDWTIQEGESDLFLKNNRSGKKYKFNLTEVS